MNALIRRSHRWCYRLKKEQGYTANAQKFLQVARKKLNIIQDAELEKAQVLHYFKVRDRTHLADISRLNSENETLRNLPVATEAQLANTLIPTRVQELEHQLAVEKTENSKLKAENIEFLTKVRDLTARNIEIEQYGLSVAVPSIHSQNPQSTDQIDSSTSNINVLELE